MKNKKWQEYSQLSKLLSLKKQNAETISVIIPTLNEEKCVGAIIKTIQDTLMNTVSLVDEIIVMDGGSTDATVAEVTQHGVRCIDVSAENSNISEKGKGLALWYAQFVAKGSIICYIDADIENFDERFVIGLVGPLLADSQQGFSKAYYTRPITLGGTQSNSGGGRVTELLIRPLFARFYPKASDFIQPLSGEYAFRTSFLKELRFSTSYAVETVLILEYLRCFSSDTITQVDMGERVHQNQSLANLGKMSAAILDHFALISQEQGLWNTKGDSVYTYVKNEEIVRVPIEQKLLPSFNLSPKDA